MKDDEVVDHMGSRGDRGCGSQGNGGQTEAGPPSKSAAWSPRTVVDEEDDAHELFGGIGAGRRGREAGDGWAADTLLESQQQGGAPDAAGATDACSPQSPGERGESDGAGIECDDAAAWRRGRDMVRSPASVRSQPPSGQPSAFGVAGLSPRSPLPPNWDESYAEVVHLAVARCLVYVAALGVLVRCCAFLLRLILMHVGRSWPFVGFQLDCMLYQCVYQCDLTCFIDVLRGAPYLALGMTDPG